MNWLFAQFLSAAMHWQLGPAIAPDHRQMAAAATMAFEPTTPRGEKLLELLGVHKDRLFHTSVEVNTSVNWGVAQLIV